MALVLKVGENNEMVPVPKNFPTCHDYTPDDDNQSNNNESGEQNVNSNSTPSPLDDGKNSAAKLYYNFSIILAITLTLFNLFKRV